MPIILKNNVDSTLAQAISSSETAAIVTAGDGAKFPALGAGDYFYATLVSAQGTREIVKVTSKSVDTLAITRAQEGTTANGFAVGSRVEMRVTAASITDLVDEHDQASEITIADAGGYYTSGTAEGALQEVGGTLRTQAAQERDTVAALLADTVFTYTASQPGTVAAGSIVQTRTEGFSYVVAASGASNQHITTAGGVKLYAQAGANGQDAAAFGLVGNGVADDTVAIQKFLTAACAVGRGIITGAKQIKTTSQLYTEFDNKGVDIDFGGSCILPDWTVATGQRITVIGFDGVSYRPDATVSIRNLQIDAVSVPYFESVSPSDRRSINGLIINNAGCIVIDTYEASDLFYGYGINLRFFNRSSLTNIKMANVGSKYRPTADDVSDYDYAGDAVYLGDVIGDGTSLIDNIVASSYATKAGRAGVVMEDLTAVTTSHVLHIRNGIFSNYNRVLHQEDRGKGRCIWEGGSASKFGCALFNVNGAAGVTYYNVKNVELDVNPPSPYGGVSGVQNFQNDGNSCLTSCKISYSASVQERGSYFLHDCDVSLGSAVVAMAYGFQSRPMSFWNSRFTFTTGAYLSSNWDGLLIDGCDFSGPSTSLGTPIRILNTAQSGSNNPVIISLSRFRNAFAEFVNVSMKNSVRVSDCHFVFSGITTGQSLVSTNFSSTIDYIGCSFEAEGIWVRIYGDAGVDSSFQSCNFYNTQLECISGSGRPDGADWLQVSSCRFIYDDSYVPTAIVSVFSPAGAMQSCLFVDKTTAQTIANPSDTAYFKTVGVGNVMAKNTGATVL